MSGDGPVSGVPGAPPAGIASGARVVLGVGAGIAAYKAADLLRKLTERGLSVRVVPTSAALKFVGEATWAALSGQPVATDVWADAHEVPHVRLGREADLVVVAPATADLIARAAVGRADDLLTATLLTARCPVLYAPAMHTEMWDHPATVANVATLRSRGAFVLEPDVGRLTGSDTGKGRLPEPTAIADAACGLLTRGGQPPDLAGRRVVITAGGTREHLDPVRYLGNSSSGKQGYAFATTAVARGASVVVIAANVSLPDPAGVELIRVVSTEEMRAAVLDAADSADAVVMAAAPADFRPATYSPVKIKKSSADPDPVKLVRNPDIAAEVGAGKRAGQLLVAFAAETGDGPDAFVHAQDKLIAKNADFIVLNDVSDGKVFGDDTNTAMVLNAKGGGMTLPRASKTSIADTVWDLVLARWAHDARRER